jgi:hypothetical protein
MKLAVSWDIMPCDPVHRKNAQSPSSRYIALLYPEDVSSTFFRNVKDLADHAKSRLRRQPTSLYSEKTETGKWMVYMFWIRRVETRVKKDMYHRKETYESSMRKISGKYIMAR